MVLQVSLATSHEQRPFHIVMRVVSEKGARRQALAPGGLRACSRGISPQAGTCAAVRKPGTGLVAQHVTVARFTQSRSGVGRLLRDSCNGEPRGCRGLALVYLERSTWPGIVRELRDVIECAVVLVLSSGVMITQAFHRPYISASQL